MVFDYSAIETAIGYKFNDKKLLLTAFTHKSFSNQNKGFTCYERLEFLGDSVLGFIVSEYLFNSDEHSEGQLTQKKSTMVSTIPLSDVLIGLGLDKYILFGKGVDNKINKKFCEDVFEALTAAVYLDGGISCAKNFIYSVLINSPFLQSSQEATIDYKSIIKIFYEKNGRGQLSYVLISRVGPDHQPIFTVALCCGDERISVGEGASKQKAEQSAAKTAVLRLKKEGYNIEF